MLRISSSVMEWKEKSGVLNKIIGQGKDIPTSNISQKVLIFEKKEIRREEKGNSFQLQSAESGKILVV